MMLDFHFTDFPFILVIHVGNLFIFFFFFFYKFFHHYHIILMARHGNFFHFNKMPPFKLKDLTKTVSTYR